MDEAAIERELTEAHQAYTEGIRRLRKRRQDAVKAALDAGMTKYKIAAVMGVKGPTLDSIIESVVRETAG